MFSCVPLTSGLDPGEWWSSQIAKGLDKQPSGGSTTLASFWQSPGTPGNSWKIMEILRNSWQLLGAPLGSWEQGCIKYFFVLYPIFFKVKLSYGAQKFNHIKMRQKYLYYVLCLMSFNLCIMSYVLCLISFVFLYVSCLICNVLCLMSYVLLTDPV